MYSNTMFALLYCFIGFVFIVGIFFIWNLRFYNKKEKEHKKILENLSQQMRGYKEAHQNTIVKEN